VLRNKGTDERGCQHNEVIGALMALQTVIAMMTRCLHV
jgi:hypothetical protein